jgi:hypothetical protein
MKNVFARILLAFIGTLLLLYGAIMPLLSVIGEKTWGDITVVRREGGERNETVSNRYTYSVGYEFTLNDGTVIYGNTKVIGNAYSAGIPMGPTAVRYLKVFPSLNALEVDAIFSMGTVILAAAGILLLVVALRREGNKKKYSKRYR